MTMKKIGTVTITEDEVLVKHFHFDGVKFDCAAVEAIQWAQGRLAEAITEQKGVSARGGDETS